MASLTRDKPEHDLEASFYGPSSLPCWYLALPCATITWSFHQTKNFLRQSISPDIVFFALYSCLAGYDHQPLRPNNDDGLS